MASYQQKLKDIFSGAKACSSLKKFKQLVLDTLKSCAMGSMGKNDNTGVKWLPKQFKNNGFELKDGWFGTKIKMREKLTTLKQLDIISETLENKELKGMDETWSPRYLFTDFPTKIRNTLIQSGDYESVECNLSWNFKNLDIETLWDLITSVSNDCEYLKKVIANIKAESKKEKFRVTFGDNYYVKVKIKNGSDGEKLKLKSEQKSNIKKF